MNKSASSTRKCPILHTTPDLLCHAFPINPSSSTEWAPSPEALSHVHSALVDQAHFSLSDGGSPGYQCILLPLFTEASSGNHALLLAACHQENVCLCHFGTTACRCEEHTRSSQHCEKEIKGNNRCKYTYRHIRQEGTLTGRNCTPTPGSRLVLVKMCTSA